MSRPAPLREQVVARLRELQAHGATGLPVVARSGVPAAEGAAGEERAPAEGGACAGGEELARLAADLHDCRRCKLAKGRTQVVFGTGSPSARVMFVGEGPGRDEDLRGEPFVGRAGQLLTEMIENGMGLRRADVYIANVVKCRPPENRNPEPDEIAECSPFLRRQVELVRPEVIVALGKFAMQTLLGSTASVSSLRGRWHDYAGIPLMPTFHPAYLLRTPTDKRLALADLQLVIDRLGPVPGSAGAGPDRSARRE